MIRLLCMSGMLTVACAKCAAVGFIVPDDHYAKPTDFHVLLEWDDDAKRERLTIQAFFETDADELWVFLPVPATPQMEGAPKRVMEGLALVSLLDPVPPEMGGQYNRITYPGDDLCRDTMKKLATTPQAKAELPEILIRPEPQHARAWFAERGMGARQFERRVEPYADGDWCMVAWKILPRDLPRNRFGRYEGATPPLSVSFAAEEPIYPMRAAAVRDGLTVDYQIYVIAHKKMNLPGNFSYLHTWVTVLQEAQKALQRSGKARPGGLNIIVEEYLAHLDHYRAVVDYMRARGWTLSWLMYARTLTEDDNVFEALRKRFVRVVGGEYLESLAAIAPRLLPGRFLTVIRKRFQSPEMNEDLVLQPAADELVGDGTFHTHWIPREQALIREVWK